MLIFTLESKTSILELSSSFSFFKVIDCEESVFSRVRDNLSTVSVIDLLADSDIVPLVLRFKETFFVSVSSESPKKISLETPVIPPFIVKEDSVSPLLIISTVLLCSLRVLLLASFFREICGSV